VDLDVKVSEVVLMRHSADPGDSAGMLTGCCATSGGAFLVRFRVESFGLLYNPLRQRHVVRIVVWYVASRFESVAKLRKCGQAVIVLAAVGRG